MWFRINISWYVWCYKSNEGKASIGLQWYYPHGNGYNDAGFIFQRIHRTNSALYIYLCNRFFRNSTVNGVLQE